MSIIQLTEEQLDAVAGGAPDNGQANGSLVEFLSSQYPHISSTTSIINPQGTKVGEHNVSDGLTNNVITNHL
jgi:uncharacterized protein YggU (UPF0235/DUF167 family)